MYIVRKERMPSVSELDTELDADAQGMIDRAIQEKMEESCTTFLPSYVKSWLSIRHDIGYCPQTKKKPNLNE